MIWTYILGTITAILCGNSTVERLLIFFGFSITVGIWDIIDILKINNNEREDN